MIARRKQLKLMPVALTIAGSDSGGGDSSDMLQRLEQEIQQLQQELQAQQQNSGSGQDASASQPAGDATNTQSGMGAWWDRERGWGRYEGFGSRFRPAWGRRW